MVEVEKKFFGHMYMFADYITIKSHSLHQSLLYYVINIHFNFKKITFQNRWAACLIFFCQPIFTTPNFCNCSSDNSLITLTVISSSRKAALKPLYTLQLCFWSKLSKNSSIEGNVLGDAVWEFALELCDTGCSWKEEFW